MTIIAKNKAESLAAARGLPKRVNDQSEVKYVLHPVMSRFLPRLRTVRYHQPFASLATTKLKAQQHDNSDDDNDDISARGDEEEDNSPSLSLISIGIQRVSPSPFAYASSTYSTVSKQR